MPQGGVRGAVSPPGILRLRGIGEPLWDREEPDSEPTMLPGDASACGFADGLMNGDGADEEGGPDGGVGLSTGEAVAEPLASDPSALEGAELDGSSREVESEEDPDEEEASKIGEASMGSTMGGVLARL